MNINYKQSQFELFPGTPGSTVDAGKPRYLFANLTLSLENAVVLSILILMFLVFSFSLGIEKGKRIGMLSASQSLAQVPAGASREKLASTVIPAVTAVSGKTETVPPTTTAINTGKPVKSSPAKAPALNALMENPPAPQIQSPGEQILVPASEQVMNTPKSYTVQVASFKREEYAQKEAAGLKNKGYEINVVLKGQHFVVCVGKFVNEKEAKMQLARLKNKYKDSLVRRL